ncbi:MAG: mannose-6-phosphate isomerase, class I [Myxococcota bacterium]
METLDNRIQPYAWGSPTAIPTLLGRTPNGAPQAELWLGAHPSAPSTLSSGVALDVHLAKDPARFLGPRVEHRFGTQLPFLLKVLAAAQPLSLQAHPTLAQAKAGFAREETAGLARSAPHRNYKDPNHKPEIICALTPFRALCGFRARADSVRLFKGLGLDTSRLEQHGLQAYFAHVMTLPAAVQGALVDQLIDAARTPVKGFEAECALAQRLATLYPRDVGIVGAMLLNLLTLEPGEALYLDAGNLHAYLEGTGVELMANSDNVLRGGLTPKHVDVPELLSVLDFRDGPARVLRPTGSPEAIYETPAPDFRLSRLSLDGSYRLAAGLPQILLVTSGSCEGSGVRLGKGASAFIGADEEVTLSGKATLFRATVGL